MPRSNPSRQPRERSGCPAALTTLDAVFANPGGLQMLAFVPPGLVPGAPLVVVLHGCTQTAEAYDRGAGWSTLAARHGFALLFPEQVRGNNANGCFNWFEAGDTRRGGGEAASIAAAVAAMVARHRLDPSRVFVTGLSAGGAMTAAMLATYPDIFAGGAIIAGLPFGAAHGIPAALAAMSAPTAMSGRALGNRVRGASTYAGPWPRVSVWHGVDDRTVSVRNGELVAAQWCDVHGAGADAATSRAGRLDRSVWRNAAGVAVVELNRIDGMAHGTPLAAGSDGSSAGPFMLDVGVAAPAQIAAFWGLTPAATMTDAPRAVPRPAAPRASARPAPATIDVGRLIGDALRSVGLMK